MAHRFTSLGANPPSSAAKIRAMVAQQPRLSGVMPYINVHLHNELLETYSLKGIWGVLLLLALYVSLFFSSFRPQRNALLLSVSASLFVYGLSDVIFFSTEGTVIFCLALIAAVLSVPKQPLFRSLPRESSGAAAQRYRAVL